MVQPIPVFLCLNSFPSSPAQGAQERPDRDSTLRRKVQNPLVHVRFARSCVSKKSRESENQTLDLRASGKNR
eukprot:1151688-Pelagomonas_calceolata.AAC.2